MGADWPANQYIGSTHWWWTGQTNGSVQGFEFRREDPLQAMIDPSRTINVNTYITPGRPNLGSNFAGVTPNGKTLWNAAREVDEIQGNATRFTLVIEGRHAHRDIGRDAPLRHEYYTGWQVRLHP